MYTIHNLGHLTFSNPLWYSWCMVTKTKGQLLAAERRKTPYQFEGLSLKDELQRMARTQTLKPYLDLRRIPKLTVRYSQYEGSSGCAMYRANRIVLTLGMDADKATVLELLLHELVHHACPKDTHHGYTFIWRLNRAAQDLWGIFIEGAHEMDRGAHKNRAYAVDTVIRTHLRGILNADSPTDELSALPQVDSSETLLPGLESPLAESAALLRTG